jgi:hypothetical protein
MAPQTGGSQSGCACSLTVLIADSFQYSRGKDISKKSWLWPLEYENTPEPLEGGPHVGCIMKMTYRVPRFDNPEIPAKPITYSYEWPQYDPEARLLEYRSLDHPLKGGAIIQSPIH